MILRFLPALLIALALGFGACGGGDDDDPGSDNEPAATADAGDGDEGDDDPSDGDSGDDDEGDDGGDDSSEGAVDACGLIAQDEAAAALGVEVGDGNRDDFPPVYSCRYETDGFEWVSVAVLVYPDAGTAREGYELALELNDYEEIDGIGEGAYFALGFGVTALKDQYEITVDVIGPDEDQPLEEELARKALGRLP